ncbi:MAG: carbohydrate ABC transporter permease [Bifidobacterium bifidum]
MTTATSQGEAHEVAKEQQKSAIQKAQPAARAASCSTAPALINPRQPSSSSTRPSRRSSRPLTGRRNTSAQRRPAKFIGFQNYITLFQSQDFWTDVKNTLVYAVLYAPIVVIIALAFALLLNRKDLKFVGFFRTCMFLPFVISLTVAAIAWQFILSPSLGLIPYWVSLLGGPSHLDLPRVHAKRRCSHHRLHRRGRTSPATSWSILPRRPAQGISAELRRRLRSTAPARGRSSATSRVPALRPTFNYVVIFGLIGSLPGPRSGLHP